VREPGRNGPAV